MLMRFLLLLALFLALPLLAHAEPPVPSAFAALAHVAATPLTPQALAATRGRATLTLQQFLALETQTSLGGGVTVYTLCPNACTVSATWSTGTSSGSGVVVRP